jgi:hypothetical protein
MKVCLNVAAAIVLLELAFTPFPAQAKTYNYTVTTSGSGTQVPVDLDGTNCTTSGGITTCPADSVLSIGGGNENGGPEPGRFTFQGVSEAGPVSGTGCSFAPSSIQGCTIGSISDGCAYTYLGGNTVDRNSPSGDLTFSTLASGSICINFDTPLPWSYVGQQTWIIAGGTGAQKGATGTLTSNFSGAILENDPQGHGLSWFTSINNVTITTGR